MHVHTQTHTHTVTLLPSLWPLLPVWQYWQLQKQHISSALYMYCSSYPSISLKPHRSVTSLLMVVFSQLPFCILRRKNLWIYMCIHLTQHNCQLSMSAIFLAFTCKMLPSTHIPDAHTVLWQANHTLWSLQERQSPPAFFFLQDFLHLLICSTTSTFFATVEFNVDGDNPSHVKPFLSWVLLHFCNDLWSLVNHPDLLWRAWHN